MQACNATHFFLNLYDSPSPVHQDIVTSHLRNVSHQDCKEGLP